MLLMFEPQGINSTKAQERISIKQNEQAMTCYLDSPCDTRKVATTKTNKHQNFHKVKQRQ
jgi:hypothetical protein